MSRLFVVIIAANVLLAGCGEKTEVSESNTVAEPDGIAGVYAGTFPCSNCPGIETELWLRPDRTFLLHQVYLADDREPLAVGSIGRWGWDGEAGLVVLRNTGPDRKFRFSDGRLDLETVSELEHALMAVADRSSSTHVVRLEGEYVSTRGSEAFVECITGARFWLVDDAGHRDLRRKHRQVSRAQVAGLATIDARIVPLEQKDEQEALAVARTIRVKPNSSCKASPVL